MSTSVATITPGNLELSPMRVTYNGVDLGATLDNVVVTAKLATSPMLADQTGSTVINHKVSGYDISITTSIAEVQLKDNWEVVFPYAELVTSGGNKQMYFDDRIGDDALSHAAVLVLHPLSKADADLSGDYRFYKVTAMPESEITYSPTGQAKMKVTFHVYPDFSTTRPRFFVYGDPAIGLIAASASTPVYTGTGNGTMTSVAVYSGFTVSETITATCVTAAANAGTFYVTGSSTGALGLATVGISFVTSKISFTINDGATDYTVGGVWSLSTVAANYV